MCMRQSLKEYGLAVSRWLWIVGIGVLFAVIGAIVDIWQELDISMWVWVAIGLLGLFIAQFMAFHKVRVSRDEVLKQPGPWIKVNRVEEGRDFYLEVNNIGGYGEFRAEVKIVSGIENLRWHLDNYLAYWEKAAGPVAEIMSGLSDRLKIAGYEITGLAMENRLYFYEPEHKRLNWFGSNSWIAGAAPPLPKPWVILQVTISSKPDMHDGPFTRKYKVQLGSFEELPD